MGKDKAYKKPEQLRPKKGAKEEEAAPKIKGCHTSIDVSGCIRPKDPIPEANSIEGVKMSCSSHSCPFASKFSVHKECFKKLTEKIVGMLERTGSSSWTDEQRVENVWRKKGLTFVGKFITCPCGHGKQCLEDSENRWSRLGEVVLDAHAYELQREEKIKKALTKQEKAALQPPVQHTLGRSLNCSFGGKAQAELAKKLERQEWAMEDRAYRAEAGDAPAKRLKTTTLSAASATTPTLYSPTSIDDDGFTTIGKDGRARETTPAAADAAPIAARKTAKVPLRSTANNMSPTATANNAAPARGTRGRTMSSSSNTSWATTNSSPMVAGGAGGGREKARTRGGKGRGERGGGGKENKRKSGYAVLSGSEDEEEIYSRPETPAVKAMQKNLRVFADEFHLYSGIGLWTESEVKELNEHFRLFDEDSALFQCRITGRRLRDPTIITQLTPATAWFFTTQAMAMQKPDIPPGTQITLQEYYAIFHDHEVAHLDDPIVWCKDGTLAVLDCVDMTMLIMGK